MSIYSSILKNIYLTETSYPTTLFKSTPKTMVLMKPITEEYGISKMMCALLYYKLTSNPINAIKCKYAYLRDTMINVFLSDTEKYEVVNEFGNTQRMYFILTRFVQKCKWHKAKVHINTDLYMNELCPSNSRTFRLLQHGKIYYFSVTDIVKIIKTSITHSSFMFSLPIRAKNPYNNIEFSKADLYNMYFKLKSVLINVPTLIHQYFMYDFDVYLLKKNHESTLMQHIIENNIQNILDEPYLYNEYLEMIHMYKLERKINVHKKFPIKRLLQVMRPYIRLFMMTKYVADPVLSSNYSYELRYKLKWFADTYPTFGRKCVQTTDENGLKNSFIDICETEYRSRVDNFMKTHLYADYNFTSFIHRGYYDNTTSYDDHYSDTSSSDEEEPPTSSSNVYIVPARRTMPVTFSFSDPTPSTPLTPPPSDLLEESEDEVVIESTESDEDDNHSDTWTENYDEDYDW
jgi:hypothetical protein